MGDHRRAKERLSAREADAGISKRHIGHSMLRIRCVQGGVWNAVQDPGLAA